MDPNDHKTIERMVAAFEQVADVIREQNPDCIIAPMMGAVPFIDILNIIDPDFPNDKVEYVPASSKLYRMRDVLRSAFGNLIEAYAPDQGLFLSLDEVVSGNSLVRVYKQFETARNEYAMKKTRTVFGEDTDFRKDGTKAFYQELCASIKYKSIGVVDPKLQRQGKIQNKEYQEIVERGIVIPVETQGIVTMDRTDFFPAQYKKEQDDTGAYFTLPVVESFQVSADYLTFLRTVAGIVGKNPDEVTVHNMGKIINSHQLVPEELRTL